MLPTHPLELPEFLLHVAAYVPLRCLPSCALVSKFWNQVFTPHIWQDIKRQDKYFGPDIIQRHRHLVKTIVLDSYFLEKCASMIFPNLESLSIVSGYGYPGFKEFISENMSASLHLSARLHLYSGDGIFRPLTELFDTLVGFNNLKILSLCRPFLENVDRLSMDLSRIEELTIMAPRASHDCGLMLLELLKRCPRLTALAYFLCTNDETDRIFHPGFIRLLSEGTWPDLKSITTDTGDILSSDHISALIRSMKQIHVFRVSSTWTIEPHHLELLRPHLDTITEMDLGRAADTTIAVAQKFLCSCPMLKRFRVGNIDGTVVAEGQSWVCLGLKELDARFIFNPLTIHHVQPLVFDQLNKLTRIEKLTLYETNYRTTDFRKSFDFRLDCGLHKLAALRRLMVFRFYGTTQRMGMEEIEWMLKHWRSLADVGGVFNKWDRQVDTKLSERLQEHGISLR
ncbi:hypothetical protein BGZ65_000886 [Modicella reniformis]|uniref:F-box domain-containing protein n=1 Tax=Modicella reniformis TaxID=1440133 RepID=A0A9P6SUB9_9FUNG|nr:hypothetical protein BGZ65_000886 [Modicella reniformis]